MSQERSSESKSERVRVLVCIASERCTQAIVSALKPWQFPEFAEFMLVHVYAPPLSPGREAPSVKQDEMLFQQAEHTARDLAMRLVNSAADKLKQMCGENSVKTTAIEDFFPADRIVQLCKEWHPDLVVLGPREHLGMSEFLMGSVSKKVVAAASSSVLLVRP